MPPATPSSFPRRIGPPRSVAIAAASVALTATQLAAAGTSTWITGAGGDFSDPLNWSPAPPGSADTALFALGSASVVAIDSGALVNRVVVRDGSVLLDLLYELEAASATALLPSLVVGDTAGLAPALSVAGGGEVLRGRFMEVGTVPGSQGTLAVEVGARLELEDILTAGVLGTAEVAIEGACSARRLIAGALGPGDGNVTVTGADATLELSEFLTVGQKGVGSLVVSGAATALTNELAVALDAYSAGFCSVSDPGSLLQVSGTADIGRNGVGTLEVRAGAAAWFGDDVITGTIGPGFIPPISPGGAGTLAVEGAGSQVAIAGTLWIALGNVGAVAIQDGGRLDTGALIFNRPASSSLAFRIDSADPAARIAVAGTVMSGESASVPCAVTFAAGFEPSVGDEFTLISATSIASTFTVTLPPVAPPRTISATGTAGGGVTALKVVIGVSADLNGDGLVDGADLGVLLALWGGPGIADLNGDGVVDGADLGLLLALWTP